MRQERQRRPGREARSQPLVASPRSGDDAGLRKSSLFDVLQRLQLQRCVLPRPVPIRLIIPYGDRITREVFATAPSLLPSPPLPLSRSETADADKHCL